MDLTYATGRFEDADLATVARRLWMPALLGGLAGGLALIIVMILVMGAVGMGYATPLNLGIPALVFTIAPAPKMLPSLMAKMGIHLPPSAMAQVGPALRGGHVNPMMVHQLSGMLVSMRVPAATVQMMGQLMMGRGTNSTVTDLLSGMNPHARASVMRAMPVSASHIAVGSGLHFVYAAFLGVLFAAVILGAAWFGLPGLRSSAGIVAAGVVGGAIVYAISRWVLLPGTNPMMALVPQLAFFLAHLLYGLVVGVALARAVERHHVRTALPASAR